MGPECRVWEWSTQDNSKIQKFPTVQFQVSLMEESMGISFVWKIIYNTYDVIKTSCINEWLNGDIFIIQST